MPDNGKYERIVEELINNPEYLELCRFAAGIVDDVSRANIKGLMEGDTSAYEYEKDVDAGIRGEIRLFRKKIEGLGYDIPPFDSLLYKRVIRLIVSRKVERSL